MILKKQKQFIRQSIITSLWVISTLSGSASAELISLDGNGFTATYNDATLGLFGAPTMSNDGKTILFSELNFSLSSNGSGGPTFGTQFATSNIQIDIKPDATSDVSGVSLIENGGYRLIDRNIVAPSSAPGVDVFGELRLTNLFTGTDSVSGNFTAGSLSTTCNTINCASTQWTANTNLTTPVWGDVAVRLRLQNNLAAEAFQTGDSAFIEKTFIGITPDVHVVPVPGAVWLFGSAMAGLVGVQRRKRLI